MSTRQSRQFYFKLGFLPKNAETLKLLLEDKEIDGGEMYLPMESISAWKNKIEKHAALISPERIHLELKSAATHAQFFKSDFIRTGAEMDGLPTSTLVSNP
ncbi:MAG: hypothetical protein ACYCQI_09255 [Gammaproteobacteria bacterium]